LNALFFEHISCSDGDGVIDPFSIFLTAKAQGSNQRYFLAGKTFHTRTLSDFTLFFSPAFRKRQLPFERLLYFVLTLVFGDMAFLRFKPGVRFSLTCQEPIEIHMELIVDSLEDVAFGNVAVFILLPGTDVDIQALSTLSLG
jgi:hypothetical protein